VILLVIEHYNIYSIIIHILNNILEYNIVLLKIHYNSKIIVTLLLSNIYSNSMKNKVKKKKKRTSFYRTARKNIINE